jgi:predicted nucleic acid-binding protein
MLADYARLRITRHPVWPYHLRMWELRHNLGAYDAAYMEGYSGRPVEVQADDC